MRAVREGFSCGWCVWGWLVLMRAGAIKRVRVFVRSSHIYMCGVCIQCVCMSVHAPLPYVIHSMRMMRVLCQRERRKVRVYVCSDVRVL